MNDSPFKNFGWLLDDIGINLKAARTLGMTTIKVGTEEAALDELQRLLGFPLG